MSATEFGRYFFEPLGSISWNQNSIGDLNLPGAAVVVQFGDVKDLDAGGGFRAGGVIMDDKVHYLEASLTNRVWDRVSGNNPVNFVNLGPLRRRVYGRDGSSTERLNLSISRLLFPAKADAATPPGRRLGLRRGCRPPAGSGRAAVRAALFDDLVCAQQNRWRYRKAEHLRFDGMMVT